MTVHGFPVTDLDTCPKLEMLQQMVLLTLEPECNRVVRKHVEHCANCQARLDELTSSKLLVFRDPPTTNVSIEATVDRLIERLCGDTSRQSHSGRTLPFPIHLSGASSGSLGALMQYHVRRELASGGTATVFEAVDTKTNQLVAIKFIRHGDENSLRRVQREVRAIRQVQHDGVVAVQSVEFADDGRMFLVMPLIPGRSLAEIIRDQLSQPPERVAGLIRQIADGLAAVHRHGVLHRDIKPSNILVDSSGTARLTDFGLAEFIDEESSLTETGEVVGTPSYMSPEQASGRQLDERSDIYSLGVTMYECLTETRAFRGPTADVLRRILNDEPISPRMINPRIPRDLELICLKAMAKEPARRYASALELRDDLSRWMEHKPILARPMGRIEQVIVWSQRNPLLAATAATLLLSIVVGSVSTSWSWRVALQERDLARENLRQAMRAVDQFYTKISLPTGSLDQPGMQPLRRELLLDAVKAYDNFLSQWPFDPILREEAARAATNLASMVEQVGTNDEIIEAWTRAALAVEPLAQSESSGAKWRNELYGCYFHRANALLNMGRFTEAIDSFSRVRSIVTVLAAESPSRTEYRRDQATCDASLGNCELRQGRFQEAELHYRSAVEEFRQLVKEDSGNPDFKGKLAVTLTNLAMVTPNEERPALYTEARAMLMASATTPLSPILARRIAKIHYSEGATAKELGRVEESLSIWRSGIELMLPHVEANPTVSDYRWMLGTLYFEVAQVLGPTDDGLAQLASAQKHREILYRADPTSLAFKEEIAVTIAQTLAFHDQTGKREQAAALIDGIDSLPASLSVYEEVALHLTAATPTVADELIVAVRNKIDIQSQAEKLPCGP